MEELRKKMEKELEEKMNEIDELKSQLEESKRQVKKLKKSNKGLKKLFEIKREHLEIDENGRRIAGAFGLVRFGTQKSLKRDVAVKFISVRGMYDREEVEREFQNQVGLVHPNVIRTYGFCKENAMIGNFGIVMEKMDCDLHQYVFRRDRQLDLEEKLMLMMEMTKGLYFLHHCEPPMLHNAVKCSNFLISKLETGCVVKICDFGHVRELDDGAEDVRDQMMGTLMFNAPETIVLGGEERLASYSVYSDVYSLGMAFWELLYEEYPFKGIHVLKTIQMVREEGKRPSLSGNLPEKLKELLRWCWKEKREERPTTDDLMDWFDENEMDLVMDHCEELFPKNRDGKEEEEEGEDVEDDEKKVDKSPIRQTVFHETQINELQNRFDNTTVIVDNNKTEEIDKENTEEKEEIETEEQEEKKIEWEE